MGKSENKYVIGMIVTFKTSFGNEDYYCRIKKLENGVAGVIRYYGYWVKKLSDIDKKIFHIKREWGYISSEDTDIRTVGDNPNSRIVVL